MLRIKIEIEGAEKKVKYVTFLVQIYTGDEIVFQSKVEVNIK